ELGTRSIAIEIFDLTPSRWLRGVHGLGGNTRIDEIAHLRQLPVRLFARTRIAYRELGSGSSQRDVKRSPDLEHELVIQRRRVPCFCRCRRRNEFSPGETLFGANVDVDAFTRQQRIVSVEELGMN